jgi:hypothetical protein
MNKEDQILHLLTEIRDNQKSHLDFAREQAMRAEQEAARAAADVTRSIANQEQAMAMQRVTARLYRRVVLVAGVLGVAAVLLIAISSYFSS